MDRSSLHDVRNDIAVAVGTLHALIDGKLPASPERLAIVLASLGAVDDVLVSLRPAGLAAREHLLSAVIEGSPYAKILVDGRGTIALVNAQTERLFGYARDELLGQSIEILVPERFRNNHPALRELFSGAPVARPMGAGRDLYGRRKDATEVPIEIGLNPVPAGEQRFTLAAVTDITERKHAERLRFENAGMARHAAELESLNAALQAASRFKTEFVATMSHELRTPLGAIVGGVQLLADARLEPRDRVVVETISAASEALLALVNSVLDFSKIEAGKMELQIAPDEIERIVAGAADVTAHLARDKAVTIHAEVDPRIPQVLVDGDRLRQVLRNLLANAVTFTDSGNVVIRAELLHHTSATVHVRFEVEDEGIGIHADAIAKLFQPFAQADTSPSRRYGGTGLGLSICKRLVELMGGRIGVRSELGRGSSFWFGLTFERSETVAPPRQAPNEKRTRVVADDELVAAGAKRAGPSDGRGILASLPVLVAEDNEHLQTLLQLQFDQLRIGVTFVTDGLAAVAAFKRERFSMIFMDCQMPRLDGFAATRLIRDEERERGGRIPIAAMTAGAFTEDRAAALRAGMDDFLSKPVLLDALRAAIFRWTGAGTVSGA